MGRGGSAAEARWERRRVFGGAIPWLWHWLHFSGFECVLLAMGFALWWGTSGPVMVMPFIPPPEP